MKFFILALLAAVSISSQASEFGDYMYLGQCIAEVTEEGQGVIEYFSSELKDGKSVKGILVIAIKKGSEQKFFSAFDATFLYNETKESVTVSVKGQSLEIPFGENKVVKDPAGTNATCNLKLDNLN
jgi:hypothetical protein